MASAHVIARSNATKQSRANNARIDSRLLDRSAPRNDKPAVWRSRAASAGIAVLRGDLSLPVVADCRWSLFDPAPTLKFYREMLAEPAYFRRRCGNTMEISGLSTLICLLLGYPLAYLMATTHGACRAAY